jgi:hypothetical protein
MRPEETIDRSKSGRYRVHHLRANFIAAGADSWAQGCNDIGRAAIETFHHGADGRLADPGNSSPPPGVRHPHDTSYRIIQHDGDAVGKGHHQRQVGRRSDKTVSCPLDNSYICRADGGGTRAMHLNGAHCHITPHPHGRVEATTVLHHCFWIIWHAEA